MSYFYFLKEKNCTAPQKPIYFKKIKVELAYYRMRTQILQSQIQKE